MNAVSSQLFTLKRGDGASTEVFTAIPGLLSLTSPNGSATVLDASDLSSPAKQKLIGLTDEGKVSITLNYFPGDTTQQAVVTDRAGKILRNFKICNAAGAVVLSFAGYVLTWELETSVDKVVSIKCDIEISGVVAWGA